MRLFGSGEDGMTTGQANTMAPPTASGQLVARSDESRPIGRWFPAMMVAARNIWRNRASRELAAIINCDVRTAERYLAGDRTAGAEPVLSIMFSDHGPQMIEAGAALLSPERQLAFWKELARSAERALLRAEREQIDQRLEQL